MTTMQEFLTLNTVTKSHKYLDTYNAFQWPGISPLLLSTMLWSTHVHEVFYKWNLWKKSLYFFANATLMFVF